jgi:DNA-directed RNA polymerase specialized sigma24 family protein
MKTKQEEGVMPYKEMAVNLGTPEKTVYAHNRDALAKARKLLKQKGFKKEDFFGDDK